MQPIQINVQVNIGLTADLYGLLSPLINQLPIGNTTALPVDKKPKAKQADAEIEVEKQPDEVQEVQETEAPAEAMPETKEYTEVDVRAAMDATRKRIEGENYKEKTDSDGYKKWHRPLTAWFKNTAAICGAVKPSALPDSDSREKFIRCCENVAVIDGELIDKLPF